MHGGAAVWQLDGGARGREVAGGRGAEGEAPPARRARRLREAGDRELVAGAYGLEDNAVVITDSLQSENLDYNEFQASIDSITLSIREHHGQVRALLPSSEVDIEKMSTEELEESIMGGN